MVGRLGRLIDPVRRRLWPGTGLEGKCATAVSDCHVCYPHTGLQPIGNLSDMSRHPRNPNPDQVFANKAGRSVENGQLCLISMGQGQEAPAEAVLDRYTKEGGWVFLDNVHLMQGWIPKLERKVRMWLVVAHVLQRGETRFSGSLDALGVGSGAAWGQGALRVRWLVRTTSPFLGSPEVRSRPLPSPTQSLL